MRKEVLILGVIIIAVIAIAVFGASYYRNSQQSAPVTSTNGTSQPAIDPQTLVRPDSPALGPSDAKVTVVEFYDPECESCAQFAPIVKKIMKEYDGKLRLVTRYMPLHPNSLSAATFTEAAGEQGKYWEAQELLFAKQPEWGTKHGPDPGPPVDINALFRKYAVELQLDQKKMDAAFAEKRYAPKLDRDKKDGQALGVRQTPTFFVNGRKLINFGEGGLRALIEDEMKK